MLKGICHTLFFIGTLISGSAFTATYQTGLPIEIDLYPGQPLSFSNVFSDAVTIQCEVRLVARENHSVLIKVLNGSGLVNGSSLKKGQTMVQSVSHLQLIPITANSGAQAQFTNLGSFVIKAICSAAS